MAVRYEAITTRAQLEAALRLKNTVWLMIIGDGPWRDTVIRVAQEQVEDQPQFMALWVNDASIITPEEKKHFLGDTNDSIVCAVAMNGGVLEERLDSRNAQRGRKVGNLISAAQSYQGKGYCLKHGEFSGNSCGQC